MAKLIYTKELLENIVKDSISYSEVCRKLNKFPHGAMWYHIKKKIQQFNIDTSHFLGKAAHAGALHTGKNKKLTAEQILCDNKIDRERTHKLRRALLEIGREYKCEICGQGKNWNNKLLMLQIDHIDKNCRNCKENNLRFLCANCHSQETHPNFKLELA
jgi:hypothetical protein